MDWQQFCCFFSPISESRRVLQESCEFFLKHNSRVQHKSKHYKSSSHKLKVVSKSMGTSTGVHTPVSSNHDNTPVSTAVRNPSVCDPPRSAEGLGSTAPAERRSKADTSSRISSRAESSHRSPFILWWLFDNDACSLQSDHMTLPFHWEHQLV